MPSVVGKGDSFIHRNDMTRHEETDSRDPILCLGCHSACGHRLDTEHVEDAKKFRDSGAIPHVALPERPRACCVGASADFGRGTYVLASIW